MESKEAYVKFKNKLLLKKLQASFYFKANVIYMIYSIGMLLINYSGWSLEIQNLNYLLFGLIHVCNAMMYLYVWVDCQQDIFTWFVLADWLNVIGALLYLITAFLYPYEYGNENKDGEKDDDDENYTSLFILVRYLELFASLIEVIAAFGWNYQWYAVYIEEYSTSKETTIGRGFTLDDPDLWANLTIDIGALYYFYYNVNLFQMQFQNYETSYLFMTGDLFYFINSVLYTIASLRDCDVFWYLPTAGIWPEYPPISLTLKPTIPMGKRDLDAHFLNQQKEDEGDDFMIQQQSTNPLQKRNNSEALDSIEENFIISTETS